MAMPFFPKVIVWANIVLEINSLKTIHANHLESCSKLFSKSDLKDHWLLPKLHSEYPDVSLETSVLIHGKAKLKKKDNRKEHHNNVISWYMDKFPVRVQLVNEEASFPAHQWTIRNVTKTGREIQWIAGTVRSRSNVVAELKRHKRIFHSL